MKFLPLVVLFLGLEVHAAKLQESDVRITFEDNIEESTSDYDGNDIVMCMTNAYETDGNGKVKTVILSLTPEAAGAYYANAMYIRNPCDGGGTIIHKGFDDSCDSAVVNTSVTTNAELVQLTSSFTRNAFSSECTQNHLVNVSSSNKACLPNKTFVKIYCDADATFSLNSDSTFPYSKLFYIDPLANGTTGANSSDDIHINSIYNGLSLINVGTCSDPVPMEKVNFIDALDLRSVIDSNKCINDASACRKEIKSAMSSKRASWSSNRKVKKRYFPQGIPAGSFSVRSFVANFETVLTQEQTSNPIFSANSECEETNDQSSYTGIEASYSKSITITNNTGSTGSNINVLVEFDSTGLISSGKMDSDCSDIMVYQGDNAIKHWVTDNSCNTTTTKVWLLVPSVALNTTTLTLYYGDLNKTNTSSGYDTFPVFFDDFNRTSNVFTHPELGAYTFRRARVTGYGTNHGLTVSNGKFVMNASSAYASEVIIGFTHPGDDYFSIVQNHEYFRASNSSYNGGRISFATSSGSGYSMSGFDNRVSGYSGRWYLQGSGGYTRKIPIANNNTYIHEIAFSPTQMKKTCMVGCSDNFTKSFSSNYQHGMGSGTRYFILGGGYVSYASRTDYVFYKKNMSGALGVSLGSENAL